MPVHSAAIVLYRRGPRASFEVLIAHPGGPFWANRDKASWTFPKGEFDPATESSLEAARREFAEEIGRPCPPDDAVDLGMVRLRSGKVIHGHGVQGDLDPSSIESNTFEIEWPRGSGRRQVFPEVDRAIWASPAVAADKLNPAQVAFIERLAAVANLTALSDPDAEND